MGYYNDMSEEQREREGETIIYDTFEKRDEYKRKQFADKIIQLLKSSENFTPILLDGYWGTGKTEFCFKLQNLIKASDSGLQCIYIDSFKGDYGEDPLLLLIASIANFLEREESDKKTVKKWKTACIPLAKNLLKIGGKGALTWILKQNADDMGEEISKTIEKTVSSSLDIVIDELIEECREVDKNIAILREALISLTSNTLLVIIDELDRCRPDFAISLLEKIKHVFDVPNVKFLLVANKQQLKASISHRYGLQIDSDRYLDKFVKLTMMMPDRVIGGHGIERNKVSIRHLRSLLEEKGEAGLCCAGFLEMVEYLFSNKNISLREAETYARYLHVVHEMSNKKIDSNSSKIFQYMFPLAVFIGCFLPELAAKLINENQVNKEEVTSLYYSNLYLSEYPEILNKIMEALTSKQNTQITKPMSSVDKQIYRMTEEYTPRYFSENEVNIMQHFFLQCIESTKYIGVINVF